MDKDYFIYHAVIELMTYLLLLKDGMTLNKDGMDGMHLYLIKRHTIKSVPITATLKLILKNP